MIARIARRLSHPVRTLSSLEAYSRWAESYPPRAHNALMEAEESAMRDLFPPLQGRTVLDLACGTGRYGLIALVEGAAQVIGLDNSPAMLRANALPIIAQSDLECLPLASGSVDVILCGLAVGHLPRLDAAMAEIGRVLKPGGFALVSDFHPFLALNGQQRTFAAPDGETYAVEHYIHLYADVHRAAGEAGLIVDRVLEPSMSNGNQEGRGIGIPLVIVYRLRRE